MMFSCLRKYFSPFVHQWEELGLLQIFKPVYILLSAVGLFPSAIEFPCRERDYTVVFKSSSVNLAPTLLITIISCVFFCLHMQDISVASEDNFLTNHPITLANYVINVVLNLLVVIVVYICALKNRMCYINILNEMAGCWVGLHNGMRRAVILGPLRVQVNCMVLGSLLLILTVQLVGTLTEGDPMYKIALVAMSFNLPEMIQLTVLTFYFVMVVMIVAVLKYIDEHLAVMVRMRMVKGMGSDYLGLKLRLSQKSVRQLRSVYGRTMAVKRQVDAVFRAPLLFILVHSFHSLVFDTHGIYHIVLINDFTTHNVVEECFWVLCQLIKFHILGHSSVLLKLQANKIGRILHDISASIKEDIIRYKVSVDINEEISLHFEIQHFSALIKLQDTEITIYGFFQLKSSLLYNVVASAAMYLVILMQFDEGR